MMLQLCSSFLSHSPIFIQRSSREDPCPRAGWVVGMSVLGGWKHPGFYFCVVDIYIYVGKQTLQLYVSKSGTKIQQENTTSSRKRSHSSRFWNTKSQTV